MADRNDVKNKIHSQKFIIPTPRPPEAATVKTYPLETIMALQKALEAGFDPDQRISPVQPKSSHERTSVRPSAVSLLAQRFWKAVTNAIARLEQRLKSTLTRKKRSRLTSAR